MNILDAVTDYAPTAPSEWTPARHDAVLGAILGSGPLDAPPAGAVEIPLVPHPAREHRRRHATLLGAGVAALTAAASAVVAIMLSGGGSSLPTVAAGAPFDPPPGLSDQALPDGKYAMEVTYNASLNSDGQPEPGSDNQGTYTSYTAGDGQVLTFGTGFNGCGYHGPGAHPGFDTPTVAFFAAMPTDVAELNDYFRSHVQGSSSLDEAVFVAVGDALRTGDGLASPKLRAAMLAVLSRTPGVIVHEGVPDYLGRPAIRADFVNQAIRPGEVQSLYFDPSDFSLLGSRDGANGAPTSYDGPSPAYTAHAPAGAVDPDQLAGQAWISVVKQERVVDSEPDHSSC